MKYLAILVGACLGLAGCVIETTSSDNSGGNGGTPSTGGDGVGGGVGGGGTGGMATGGSGGAGGAVGGGGAGGGSTCPDGMCVTCSEAVTPGLNDLGCLTCEGASTELYNGFVDCLCEGACKDVCTDNVCAGADISADCETCAQDTAVGCGNEFNECANDF